MASTVYAPRSGRGLRIQKPLSASAILYAPFKPGDPAITPNFDLLPLYISTSHSTLIKPLSNFLHALFLFIISSFPSLTMAIKPSVTGLLLLAAQATAFSSNSPYWSNTAAFALEPRSSCLGIESTFYEGTTCQGSGT
ncbi:hypothetical protein JMJ35_006882 [Cladonia borealis]|uniref:Uncharacterized protein n=1 Tax=Cladonia borealis TaxID=184061 RepID=A0AA39V7K5_9LECA|nr:hypothetical protein JMJ35_006882 [Cladonia borealis]